MLFLKTISAGIMPTAVQKLGIYNNKREALTQAQQAEFLNFIRESK